jgi:hypothetical protein
MTKNPEDKKIIAWRTPGGSWSQSPLDYQQELQRFTTLLTHFQIRSQADPDTLYTAFRNIFASAHDYQVMDESELRPKGLHVVPADESG